MAGFDKYSNYNENTSFSSVVFGAEKPVLETELNEVQQIIASKLEKLCSVVGVGFHPISNSNVVFNNTNKQVTVSGGVIITSTGLLAVIKEPCSVVVSTSNPYVYFEVEEVDVTKDSELHAYGNTAGTIIDNPILDSRFPVETTRRKVVTYTLKAGVNSNLTNVVYVGVGTLSGSTFTLEKVGLDKFRSEVIEILADPVFTNSISMGRKVSSTVGQKSVALGYDNNASGKYSFAQGEGNTASSLRAVALGFNNTASNTHAFAIGSNNTASGTGSFVSGSKCKATADYSYAEGNITEATGYYAHAMGTNTKALQNQLVIGAHNDDTIATQNSLGGTTGNAFVIGNGTSSAKSNAFRVQSDGVTYAKGAYNATGADYAEYAEWVDGNPNNEDRRGYFVTFDEEKPNMIRKAKATDIDILGVTSGNPCIIGNSDECWLGKNLFDEFNSPIYEAVEEVVEIIDEETGEVIDTNTILVQQHKVNPNYDPTQEYKHRSERPEWSAVGWIGVLPVREDGTCEVGGYCTWGDDGIATSAEPSRFNYRVIERVNENIVKIVLK